MSLEQALAFTLPAEGGFVDNPADHGGATNRGVTQRVYDQYRAGLHLPIQSVAQLSNSEVSDLYHTLYWNPAHCFALATRLGIAHMDWAVNHGVTGAIKTLQQACAVLPDGIFGPHTLDAINAQSETSIVNEYLLLRREWYQQRAKDHPDQAEFLAGWLKRVDQLAAYVGGLA